LIIGYKYFFVKTDVANVWGKVPHTRKKKGDKEGERGRTKGGQTGNPCVRRRVLEGQVRKKAGIVAFFKFRKITFSLFIVTNKPKL